MGKVRTSSLIHSTPVVFKKGTLFVKLRADKRIK